MKKTLAIIMTACALGAQAQTLTATVEQTEHQKAWTVTLALQTAATDYASMQFDVEAPAFTIEGIEKQASQVNHTLAANESRVIIYSMGGAAFASTGDGLLSLCSIRLTSTEELAAGNYDIQIKDIRLANVNGTEKKLADVKVTVESSADGVAPVVVGERADVYTLTGRLLRRGARMADLPAGVYIVGGRKFIKR